MPKKKWKITKKWIKTRLELESVNRNKRMLKGYISQYWQQYNTFACIGITHCMYEIGCIDIVVSQQIWNNTYVLTT